MLVLRFMPTSDSEKNNRAYDIMLVLRFMPTSPLLSMPVPFHRAPYSAS